MTAWRLEIDVTGAERNSSRLVQLEHRLSQPARGFNAIADYLRRREARLFASRGDGRWEPQHAATVRKKGHSRLLFLTGAAQRSLTVRGARGAVQAISGQVMTFGSSLFYLRFVAKRRPVFRTTSADRHQAASRFTSYLMESIE